MTLTFKYHFNIDKSQLYKLKLRHSISLNRHSIRQQSKHQDYSLYSYSLHGSTGLGIYDAVNI